MKISVVIPAYNEEEYIGNCLDTILKQSLQPDEVIVVNNNSTDRTEDIAQKYGANVVTERKQGMIFARNAGFNHAQYEIVARCDSDCKPSPTWLESIHTHFETNNADLLGGAITYYDLPLATSFWTRLFWYGIYIISFGKKVVFGPNMAIKKTMWHRIKDHVCLDDTIVHEDFDLAFTVQKHSGNICFAPNIVMPSSGRRICNNPMSFFGEYTIRTFKTITHHSHICIYK